VRKYRAGSKRETTKKLAGTPSLFGEIRQPSKRYLAVPKTSSENRDYIPMAFLEPSTIANTELFTISHATAFHFGVLSSAMHMAWVRQVCGRLKSDLRYSAKLVYNNFPWPEDANETKRALVEEAATKILDLRVELGDGRAGFLPVTNRAEESVSLADLYNPIRMPPVLVKAHRVLDRTVDRCYRSQPFTSDWQRVEYLFALYEKLLTPMLPVAKRRRSKRN
jgi:hypothetical protein